MKRISLVLLPVTMLMCFCILSTTAFAGDATEPPIYLASIGDSMTEAIDAEVFGANHWASWVNGYHGFWQWLFGLTNVKSHNQRISRLCGWRNRKNYMEAKSGADSWDVPGQAQQAISHSVRPTYVTMLMGHNDVCQNNFLEITSPVDFEDNIEEGLEKLKQNLPAGATIYVLGIVDVTKLYDVAKDKLALGIVDCEVLWFFTLFDLFPCGTVLGPGVSDAHREWIKENVIMEYNTSLEDLVNTFDGNDPDHHYVYTDVVTEYDFQENHVSDLDCFHPSAYGQKVLSYITWQPVKDTFNGLCQ